MNNLIGKHGGYKKLRSFHFARLVYRITVRFCDRYIDKFSRTKDQMVQAARSGVQNIAEGSKASAVSKKTELKLTEVARASLEELKLDYQDFINFNNFREWKRDEPLRQQVIDCNFETADQVSKWISEKCHRISNDKDVIHNKLFPEYSANATLTLIYLTCYLLDKQIKRLADDFVKQGGFTERMYRARKEYRNKTKNHNQNNPPSKTKEN